jgi:lipoprotein-releasing system permease protein
MSYERFMAWRYLRGAEGSEEGQRFLRVITYLAIGGVTVGVAALLLALSTVRGFSQQIEQKVAGFGSHVQVEHIRDRPLGGQDTLMSQIAAVSEVLSVRPVIEELILLRSPSNIEGAALVGSADLSTYLSGRLVSGSASVEPDTTDLHGIVIGQGLARLLGVGVGDLVTALSMQKLPDAVSSGPGQTFPQPDLQFFYVAGVFDTGLPQFDDLYAFTAVEPARELLNYGPQEVSRFDLTLSDIGRADEVAGWIERDLGFPVMARSIYQVYRNLFAWINLQKSVIPMVIAVIIIVAAFNIMGTLLIVILEKTRDIGIISSMGLSARRMQRLFLWLGVLIGAVGTVLGESLALILALIQLEFGVIPVPEEAYYVQTAPIALNGLDFVWVALGTVVLCGLAAYIPARVAARMEPVRSIRLTT